MYAFLSPYPYVFTTHLLFNAHKRNQLTVFLQQFGKMAAMVLLKNITSAILTLIAKNSK